MTLSDYLQSEGIKASHLADRIGVPASTVTRILRGARDPGLEVMRKIAVATEGKVTPNDFVFGSEGARSHAPPAA